MKYRAEMADLRNFYNDKGVLYFVVCLRELEEGGFEKKDITLVYQLLN